VLDIPFTVASDTTNKVGQSLSGKNTRPCLVHMSIAKFTIDVSLKLVLQFNFLILLSSNEKYWLVNKKIKVNSYHMNSCVRVQTPERNPSLLPLFLETH